MNFVKIILGLVLGLLLIGGAVWQFWLKDQVAFAKVATAYGAKQVCSCLFVGERELDSCLGDFTADVSAVSFDVSSSRTVVDGQTRTNDTVTASVLGGLIQDTARFHPNLGCALVDE